MGAFGPLNMGISGAATIARLNQVGQEASINLQQDQDNIYASQVAESDALARGTVEAGRARQQYGRAAAKQLVAFSNSGVDASVGTAADVQAETRGMGDYEAQVARNNAAREAWGHRKQTEALRRRKDLNLLRSEGEVTGTILGGLASGANAGFSGYSGGGQ